VFPMLETLRIASPAYLQQFELPLLQSLSVEGTDSVEDGDPYVLWIESIPEGITSLKIEDVVLATLSDHHPQQRVFGNLATIEMSRELGVDLNVRDKFFATQLKEVNISRARLHDECDNEEDVYLQFIGTNGLLARSPITHIHVRALHTSSLLLTSLLDTNNLILPKLTFVDLTQWYSRVDYGIEDLKRDFSSKRSNVLLSVSAA
jgi:hypothetical protein